MNTDIEVTFELLEKLKSPRGGYSRLALESLGIKWPPPKGWRKELIRKAKESHIKETKIAPDLSFNMNIPFTVEFDSLKVLEINGVLFKRITPLPSQNAITKE